MEDIMGWIKQVVCYLCVFQIFLQILPDGTSKKYVQFFGSLILVLLVARPLTDLTGTTLDLEKEIRFFMAQEELSELTMGMEGLNELQNDSIDEAFRRELARQVEELAAGCGLKEPEVSLSTLRDTQGILQVNRISIDASGTKEAAQEAVRQICALYGLPQGSVTVHGWTAADAERQG